jgi:hypothetical protein
MKLVLLRPYYTLFNVYALWVKTGILHLYPIHLPSICLCVNMPAACLLAGLDICKFVGNLSIELFSHTIMRTYKKITAQAYTYNTDQ